MINEIERAVLRRMQEEGYSDISREQIYVYSSLGSENFRTAADLSFDYSCLEAKFMGINPLDPVCIDRGDFYWLCKRNLDNTMSSLKRQLQQMRAEGIRVGQLSIPEVSSEDIFQRVIRNNSE